MKSVMRKVLVLLLAVAMMVSTLAACNKQGGEEKKDDTTTAAKQEETKEAETEPAADDEIVNLVFVQRGVNGQPDEAAVVEAANKYSAEKIGVTVTYISPSGGDFPTEISRMLAAKEEADVFFMASYTNYADLARNNALYCLDDYLASDEGANLKNTMADSIWGGSLVDGKCYIVPNYKESGVGYGLITPQAAADEVKEKYGIDFNEIEFNSIWDAANLEDYLVALKELGYTYPVINYCWSLSTFLNVDSTWQISDTSNAIAYNMETGELKNMYEIPEVREYYKLMRKWNEMGLIPEDELLDDFSNTEPMQAGDYGVGNWTTVPQNEANASDRWNCPVYCKPIEPAYVTVNSAIGSGFSVSAYTEKFEAAMKWIELIETDTAFADLWIYGIEGTHYNIVDGGVEKIADTGWSSSGWKWSSVKNYTRLSSYTEDFAESYDDFNNASKLSPLAACRVNYTAVEGQNAAVKAAIDEYKKSLDLGFFEDVEAACDDCVAAMNAAGFADLLAEVKAQYEAAGIKVK